MKVMASYGFKKNDENFFVSIETKNNIEIENAPRMSDELFKMAKESIQRQVGHVSLPEAEGKENQPGDENGSQPARDGKITPKQMKFVYTLLKNSKKLFDDEATDFLRRDFGVKSVKDIPFKQADAFIKKMLQEIGKK